MSYWSATTQAGDPTAARGAGFGDPSAFGFVSHIRQTISSKPAKADDTRINVEQDHEVKYWSEKFGVSRDELRSAVAKAGPMVKDVQAHLQQQGAEQRWNGEGGNLQTAESRQRE